MSDPVTAAIIIGASVIQGFAQKEQADRKAKGLKLAAERELQVSEAEAKQFNKRESAQLAAARAARAASGVTFKGSPLLVDEDTVEEIALQRANIINAGQVRAQRLRESASAAKVEGRVQRFATIIGGVSKAAMIMAPTPTPTPDPTSTAATASSGASSSTDIAFQNRVPLE